MVEVRDHRVGESEVVRREDELVSPAVVFLQHTVGADSGLCSLNDACANGAHAVTSTLPELGQVTDSVVMTVGEALLLLVTLVVAAANDVAIRGMSVIVAEDSNSRSIRIASAVSTAPELFLLLSRRR